MKIKDYIDNKINEEVKKRLNEKIDESELERVMVGKTIKSIGASDDEISILVSGNNEVRISIYNNKLYAYVAKV